jgi:hypothetical protein
VNEINRALLGNPDRFENYAKDNTREFENFEVRYGGTLLIGGTLVVQNAGDETYKCWLRSDVGNLGKIHREKFIGDSYSFNQNKTFENKADYDPDTDPYGCPKIYNPDFFKEKGEKGYVTRWIKNPNYMKLVGKWKWWGFVLGRDDREYIVWDEVETEDFTEAFLQSSGWMVNDKNEDGTIRTPETESKANFESITGSKSAEEDGLDVAVVSPMLFVNYVLKQLFKDAGFALGDNFLSDDADLKRLVLYHNFDITRFQFIPSLYGWLDYYRERQLWYDAAIGQAVDIIKRDVNAPFVFKDLLPQMKLKDFLLGLQNLLNVCFVPRPGRRIFDVIDREKILTDPAIDIDKYLTGKWRMDTKKNITLKLAWEHDNDDLIFKEGWTDIDEYRDKEREPVDTWSDLENIEYPLMDEVRYVRETNTYAQYKMWNKEYENEEGETIQEKRIGWSLLTIAFQHGYQNYGQDEEEELQTKFSTLSMNRNSITDGYGSLSVRQKGNIRTDVYAYESFSPRLLFYTGNNEGANETDNISLDWEKEETGLLTSRWLNWSRFWTTRQQVECDAHFSPGMLDYVIRNITKKYRGLEGEFIIEKMETEIGTNYIGVTKIRGHKLNYTPRIWTLNDAWNIDDVIWIDEEVDMTHDFEEWDPL